jgi:leader peptidase (prepilin peptidase)/N-methyltransferase
MVEWIVPLTDAVVTVLLLVIGGNLGSFLNVVVHRLPRGESVVHGGSHCPTCGAAIRWHDNVPVFGWLLLGGRCRDCGVPIAARYPLLEAAGAVFIGGVFMVG